MKTILLGIATFLLSCNGPIQKVNEYIGHAEAKLPVEILIEGMPDVAYWDVVNGAATDRCSRAQGSRRGTASRPCARAGLPRHRHRCRSSLLPPIHALDTPSVLRGIKDALSLLGSVLLFHVGQNLTAFLCQWHLRLPHLR